MEHFVSRVILFVLLLFSTPSVSAQLFINEWMPDNDNYLVDQAGEYDDWFEIYNAGPVTVNLKDYFLSDDPSEPDLFQVEENLFIPSGGFLLLWADKDLDQGDNHVNFKLSASGESILLSDPNGNLIHEISFGVFPKDFSSGLFPDGTNNQIVFNQPTPSAANNGQVILETLSVPGFSLNGGFYTQNQTLSLDLPSDATQIYYSLNSTAPHPDSSDTFLYTNPITIDETTVVRAIAVATGFQDSPIASEIFYLNTTYNLPTLSIIADPEDLFGLEGIYTNPFESGSAWERFCQLELFETNGGGFSIDAGIRIQGSSSVGAAKKSFRIFFEEAYGNKYLEYPLFNNNPVEEFRNIVLRSGYDDDLTTSSGTLLRDPFSSDIYEASGGLVSDRRWAVLTINGEYWGIYDIRESVNEHFIESHINEEDFDMIRMTKFDDDLKEGSLNDWVALRNFLNHNDCSDPEIYEQATEEIDVENLINFLAFIQITGYNSWTWGTSIYKKHDNGKWRFTPWDMDRSLFINEWNGFAAIEDTSGILYNNYLPKSLIRNEGFRNQYLNRTADLLNTIGKSSEMLSSLDDLKNEISEEIPSELNRWAPTLPPGAWENELGNVVDFLERRPDSIRLKGIEAYGLSGMNEITLDVNGVGNLEVNTLDLEMYPWSGIYFEEVPIRIKAVPNPGYAFVGWSDPDLPMNAEIEIDVKEYSNLTAIFILGNNDELNIVINEINYHSSESTDAGDWIELYNADTTLAQLAGWSFKDESGKSFTLTDNTVLPSGEYLVLVADKEKFQEVYPFIDNVVGNFGGINDSGFSLSNGGELIQLINADGSFMDEVHYLDDAPWPVEADGQGPSLQLIQPYADNALAQNWLASDPTPGSINFLFLQTIDFLDLEDQPKDTSPIVLSAMASSDLPVSFELLSGPAMISGNLVTLTGAVGIVSIQATQSGNDEYQSAPPVTRSFEVFTKEDQTIIFPAIEDQPTDASPINLVVTATSGLTIDIEIISGPAVLNNNMLTLTGEEGTVTIQATQSGNNFYNPAPMVTRSFTVFAKEDQTINFAMISDQPVDASPINLVATSSNGLAVDIELLSGPAILNNNMLTLTGLEGTVTIQATQLGNDFYNSAPTVTRSFTVFAADDQTINFPPIVDQPTDASPINLVATSSSGLVVDIELSSGPAILNNNILTLTGEEGTVTIQATQLGNDFYNPAPTVTRSFTVFAKEDQTINFPPISNQPTDISPINLVATSSSDLAVDIELLSGPASLSSNLLILTGAEGTVTVRARQLGNNFYNPAPAVTRSFEVFAKEDQTINFATIADQPTDATPALLVGSASSGLIVGYEILSGPASLIGNTIELDGNEGLVSIRAFQNGNTFYNAASDVIQEFNVYEKEIQTIDFSEIPDQFVSATEVILQASASSGLPVSYEMIGGPATISGNTLILDGTLGIVSIRAIQNGDLQFGAAPSVIRSFTVIEQNTQTIELSPISDQPTTAPPIILSGVASSGLPIQYEIISGPATLENGNEVVLNGLEGVVMIEASQPGDLAYAAAPPVNNSFEVVLLDTDFPLDNCSVDMDSLHNPYIVGLNFGSILSTSENEGYANNTDQTTILRRGSITPLNVEVEHSVDAYLSIWIDFNRDGNYEAETEVVYEGILLEGSVSSQLETMVNVPLDARIGATRMRVIIQKDNFADPCLADYYGEVEDYGIYLEVVTSLLEEEELPITLYPNPFSDELTINWEISEYHIMIYNSIGEQIYETMTNDISHIIPTNLWNNGIYILKVVDNKGKMTSRVLIK